jgi:hypothetical protein
MSSLTKHRCQRQNQTDALLLALVPAPAQPA